MLHWSSRVNAPAATNAASAAKAAARSAALRRYTHAQRCGDDLEPGRRRSDLLAVELDRQPLGCIDCNAARAEQLDLRMRQIGALVDLRRRRHEVALRDVPDQDHV